MFLVEMVWFRKYALARTALNGISNNEGNDQVLLRRRGENKDEERNTETNVAMESHEEQYFPSDFINHLLPDEPQMQARSLGCIPPVDRQSIVKVAPQTIIRPVPIMPVVTSVYSTPPTYIDNIPPAVNVSVMHSSLLATHLVTNSIALPPKQETKASSIADIEVQPQNTSESARDLQNCKWLSCERKFRCLEELVAHVNDYHTRVERPDVGYQCKWNGCPRKGKGFDARYKMVIHIRTHTNEKPHTCSRCGKSFSRQENLKIHFRSHTGEKPYTCPFEGCNKAYSNSSDRFKHVRTHRDDKPYICKMPGCSKRYTDPSSLRKHVRAQGHRYKEGSQMSASLPLNSNLVQDGSGETIYSRISNADYSISVTNAGSVPSITDSNPQGNSCLRLSNISSLVSSPLCACGSYTSSNSTSSNSSIGDC